MTGPPGSGRIAAVAAILFLGLLGGCATGSDDTEPGAEQSEFTDPVEESSGFEEEDDPGPNPVSVELPGLPVGGPGAAFSGPAPETQCVDVNLTGLTLSDGVGIQIAGFTVAEQFTVDAGQCPDAPPCLGGHVFTSEGIGCQVAVTWTGAPVDTGSVELGVSSATAVCDQESWCQEAFADVQAAGLQTITLTVFPSEEETS